MCCKSSRICQGGCQSFTSGLARSREFIESVSEALLAKESFGLMPKLQPEGELAINGACKIVSDIGSGKIPEYVPYRRRPNLRVTAQMTP